MPELFAAKRGVCRNFCGLKGGYAGTFVGSGGDAGNIMGLVGGVGRTFCGLRGGYAGNFVSSGGV